MDRIRNIKEISTVIMIHQIYDDNHDFTLYSYVNYLTHNTWWYQLDGSVE